MDKTKLIERLMATFLQELDEHVRSLSQDLLALEKNTTGNEGEDRLRTLFRSAHSLKGAARSVNVTLIEGACHALEELLGMARDGRLTFHAELFKLLFATVDAIEEAAMRLREQQDLAGSPLAALLPQLEAAAGGLVTSPAPTNSSAPQIPNRSTALEEKALARPTEARAEIVPSASSIAPPTASPVSASAARPKEIAPGASTLRVSADKLDTMLARVGELLVARRRVRSRLSDLATLRESVEGWHSEWQRVEKTIDKALGREEQEAGRSNGTARSFRRAHSVVRQTGDRLRRLSKDLDRLATLMSGDNRFLEQVAGPLNDDVRDVRMLPFAEACAGLDRMVRDLTQSDEKEVDLQIEGGAVELDRSVLEGLKDPLRHLVRNAIDHGIERPEQRQQARKPRCGRIVVAAALRGGQVEVTVQDDGRGLDLEALREQSRRRGMPEPTDERKIARLAFLPGLSTASIITDVSGRGVGLDVVQNRVESLHGTVDLASTPGVGTSFTLTVPLTLTTLRAVLVNAGGQTYAFACSNVRKFQRAQGSDVRSVAGRDMLTLGGPPLPFASLARFLRQSSSALGEGESEDAGQGGEKIPILIIAAGEHRMAFAVDEFVAEQEILVKSLGNRLRHVPLVAGATLLPSGHIGLVLNAANLIRGAMRQSPFQMTATKASGPAPTVKKRLLVVEDSVTTRTLEKAILEAAGYEVATSVDGQAGWQFLQTNAVDLVVSDVEMPHMDGFQLTETIRASPKLRTLPVVLVTSRGSDQDKERGIAVGADAYLVKSAFEQRSLLETIAQLL